MNYKITTLAENSVYGKGLQGEHGLSLLVEAGDENKGSKKTETGIRGTDKKRNKTISTTIKKTTKK